MRANPKRILLSASLALFVAGCVSDVGYRPNTTLKAVDNAYFQCRVAAAKNVPANLRIRSTPGTLGPVFANCVGGRCGPVGGYYGGQITSYDTNTSLRRAFFQRCIADKGFTISQMPQCTSGQLPADFKPSLRDRLNRPGNDPCYYKVTNFANQIVNPD
ncbi:MAG: hypothetical protein AAF724_22275 [Pseudomonadota bacterium]